MNPPTWLTAQGKRIWRRYTKLIEVTPTNQDNVALLADALAAYRQAAELVKRDGLLLQSNTGILKRHPAIELQKQSFSQVMRLHNLLGIGKVEVIEEDELDELLGG